LKQVHRWFKEKTDQFKRVDESGVRAAAYIPSQGIPDIECFAAQRQS